MAGLPRPFPVRHGAVKNLLVACHLTSGENGVAAAEKAR
jgi:hypothetical protein